MLQCQQLKDKLNVKFSKKYNIYFCNHWWGRKGGKIYLYLKLRIFLLKKIQEKSGNFLIEVYFTTKLS